MICHREEEARRLAARPADGTYPAAVHAARYPGETLDERFVAEGQRPVELTLTSLIGARSVAVSRLRWSGARDRYDERWARQPG